MIGLDRNTQSRSGPCGFRSADRSCVAATRRAAHPIRSGRPAPHAPAPTGHASPQLVERRIPSEAGGQRRMLQHDVASAGYATRDQHERAVVRERTKHDAARRGAAAASRQGTGRVTAHHPRLRGRFRQDADRRNIGCGPPDSSAFDDEVGDQTDSTIQRFSCASQSTTRTIRVTRRPFGRPRLVNHRLDAVDDPAADDHPEQGVARLHGAGRQARQRRCRVGNVR